MQVFFGDCLNWMLMLLAMPPLSGFRDAPSLLSQMLPICAEEEEEVGM